MRMATIFMLRACALLCLLAVSATAQFTYTINQEIPVEANNKFLSMAWAGGLNSAQINTMDLDGDDIADLVVFDRASGRITTFLRNNNAYQYSPEYAQLFPTSISHWMLLRDFNRDGKKDLFTSDPFGISVYVNTTTAGGNLSWREFNPGFPLLTEGFSGNINLKVNETDLPAIDDVDGDGDLDILNMRFVGQGTVEWHKNLSFDNTGGFDSLMFKRVTQNYGNFEECSCGVFAFEGESCPTTGGGRVQHVGGKNMLTIDLDNDGDRELLFAEENCNRVYTLNNTGDADNAVFANVITQPYTLPVVALFPAPYYEDVDFDGKPDLIVSPNVYARTFTNLLVNHSVLLFKNTGTTQAPAFTFVKDNFLQEEMIEAGDYSVPAFGDLDNDGDEDMLVGYYAGQNFIGSVQHYENTGTASMPSFRLVTENYFGLGNSFSYNFKPQIVDMNRDGKLDIAYTSTNLQNGFTSLQYLRNDAESGMGFTSTSWTDTGFLIGQAENLRVVDVNLDGRLDFLVGKGNGMLQYWENRDPAGGFTAMTMINNAFLGVGPSTSRLNPVVAVGDLDADGLEDLVLANHRGVISIYPDFRNFDPAETAPITEMVYNSLLQSNTSINLGGRIWPTIVNLFNSDKPAVVVGNTSGGLTVLKNVEGAELPEEPNVVVFPNPVAQGDTLKVRSDRPAQIQVFSMLGQKMSELIPIAANRNEAIPLNHIASGMYIMRFTIKGKHYAERFVLY